MAIFIKKNGTLQRVETFQKKNGNLIGSRLFNTSDKITERYLTFSSPDTFTLTSGTTHKTWDGILEYSTDTINWIEWNGTTISSSQNGTTKYLYLRGIKNTTITSIAHYNFEFSGTNISCTGYIENLIDYTELYIQNISYGDGLSGLFGGVEVKPNYALITPPQFYASSVCSYAYGTMFRYCKNLSVLPYLPAKKLTQSCYQWMFQGCTQLSGEKLNLSHVTDISATWCLIGIGVPVRFGTALEITGSNTFGSDYSNPITYEIWFDHSENDTVLFNTNNFITAGSSKATITYNIYTDNTNIKTGALSQANTYTIVNVYHLDGTSW